MNAGAVDVVEAIGRRMAEVMGFIPMPVVAGIGIPIHAVVTPITVIVRPVGAVVIAVIIIVSDAGAWRRRVFGASGQAEQRCARHTQFHFHNVSPGSPLWAQERASIPNRRNKNGKESVDALRRGR